MSEAASKLHYLIGSRGDPIPLPLSATFTMGRADGNNIFVDDPRASRYHAEIFFDGDNFTVTDMQSSNGTFLNNKDIDSVILKDGDIISIGLVSYTYRCVNDITELAEAKADTRANNQQTITQEMPVFAEAGFAADGDFNGTLASIQITDLCQLLNFSRRNGLLLVQAALGRAMIYVEEGEPVQAEYGPHQGAEAAMEILKVKTGHFAFKADKKPLERNLNSKMHLLLLEAARLSDENVS